MQRSDDGVSLIGGNVVSGALQRCVAAGAEEFAADYWDRAPLLSPALGDYLDLLDLDGVDELLGGRALRTPFVRMAKDGHVIPPARYTGSGGAGAEIGDQVRDEKVLALLADGATLVLQGLHRMWPPLVAFASTLRQELGTPVQINAYLTPPSSRGFDPHYDTHGVFVLQVSGRKHWRIHAPVLDAPVPRQPWGGVAEEVAAAASGEPVIDTVLTAGDALYLPRGWLHSAATVDEWSLHLTIGLHAPTRLTLLDALQRLAVREPRLRAGLPMGLDPADAKSLAPALADTVAALHEWLDSVTPEDLAAQLRGETWSAARPGPLRPIAQASALSTLGPEVRVTARPGLPVRLDDPSGGRIAVHLPDRSLSLPESCADAVRTVMDGRAHRVGDLPGLDDADRIVLTRRLLREAALVLA
ncbi:cupin domain-containing protein [Dactylosporangium sp. NPDC051541]|uniref:cupin domain-containing protein n=1 Tax=Dactylosporangium sp. NPDC051541 TaxID=3363977 RepID=UPI00379D8712